MIIFITVFVDIFDSKSLYVFQGATYVEDDEVLLDLVAEVKLAIPLNEDDLGDDDEGKYTERYLD